MTATARRDEIERYIAGPTAPSSVAAERALIGVVLADPRALDLTEDLRAPHFFEPLHGRLWAAIQQLHGSGVFPDAALLDGQFANDETYRAAGGHLWLSNLAETAPGKSKAPAYVAAVKAAAQMRLLLRLGEDTAAQVRQGEAEVEEVLADVRRKADEIERDAADADASLIAAPAVARRTIVTMEQLAANGRPRGYMTGLRCIDRRLNGLKPGHLIVVGGRPGMCKTGLARAAMHGAAVRNPNLDFLFFSQEMGPDEVMQRELSALTHEYADGVEYRAMESGALTPMDFMSIASAEARVPPNLIFDDRCSSVGLDDIRRKVWARNRKRRVGAIAVDYLQLIVRPPAKGRNETSVVGDMTRGFKLMAQQAGMAVLLLSQLSRQVESRDDKKPQLNDLRESGSIEQDADAVLFPFREHYYLVKNEPKATDQSKHLEWELRCTDTRRQLDVYCAKQRGGPEGTDRQRYFAEYDYIEDDHDRA